MIQPEIHAFLEKELRLNDICPDELEQVLLSHYKQEVTVEDLSTFGKEDSRLVLRYTKTRLRIEEITDADIPIIKELIQRSLIKDQTSAHAQAILFSLHHPIKGFFKYKNIFQLVPSPDNAPQPTHAAGEHSCLIQTIYTSSTHTIVNMMRAQRSAYAMVDILNVLTRGAFKRSANTATKAWVITEVTSDGKVNYGYQQTGYGYDGFNPLIKDFSDTSNIPPLPLTPEEAYYESNGGGTGEPLRLPASINRDLDAAFGLAERNALRFRYACTWAHKAREAWSTSRSLAFIGAVTAIEALINETTEDRRCEKCNRQTTPGSGIRFREFIKKFVSDDKDTQSLIENLYKTRSLLSHGKHILHSDTKAYFHSHRGMRDEEQLHALNMVMYHVIRGWLLEQQGHLATDAPPVKTSQR